LGIEAGFRKRDQPLDADHCGMFVGLEFVKKIIELIQTQLAQYPFNGGANIEANIFKNKHLDEKVQINIR
jgi:hypothetical protein